MSLDSSDPMVVTNDLMGITQKSTYCIASYLSRVHKMRRARTQQVTHSANLYLLLLTDKGASLVTCCRVRVESHSPPECRTIGALFRP